MESRASLLFTVLFAVLASGCGGSDKITEPDVLDFSGTWAFEMTVTGGGTTCPITGRLSVVQEGAVFNGLITDGLEPCTHNGESWPTVIWTESQPVDGVATRTQVTFFLRDDSGADLTFSGSPDESGDYTGSVSGRAELGAFSTDVVELTGSWTTTR
jgi:hypothetical protein